MTKKTKLWIKTGLSLAISGLVGLFTGQVIDMVAANSNADKFSKLGAKVGGSLVGYYIGDQVTDHILSGLQNFVDLDDEDDEMETDE